MGGTSRRALCQHNGCAKFAQTRGLCKVAACTKLAQSRGHCIAHGGGRKCQVDECEKLAQSKGYCIAHGGGRKCAVLLRLIPSHRALEKQDMMQPCAVDTGLNYVHTDEHTAAVKSLPTGALTLRPLGHVTMRVPLVNLWP
ncbi:hypothetical protein DYB28_014921 [Aphanomyces astaci]|uniref:WRKY19-like zinc finger domain-containing protein n=1 Tax=Aphanomyces astaci TaxID=112090 RepID=A0A9X8H656_APHAT|nr:hypothetical protein DYB28_014921 [Aphanomyces astaci]